MAAGADSHVVTVTSRQCQCLDDVARRCTLGDHRRTLVDHSIEDRPKFLISGILCSNEVHAALLGAPGWLIFSTGSPGAVHTEPPPDGHAFMTRGLDAEAQAPARNV